MCCADIVKVTKNIFLVMNTVVLLVAIPYIIFGVIVLTSIIQVQLVPENQRLIGILTTVFGAVTAMATAIGYHGAIRKLIRSLLLYIIFLLALIAVKIWMVAVIFMNMDDIYNIVRTLLESAFLNVNLTASFISVELYFRCCGTTGPNSYYNNDRIIPRTCCSDPGFITCDSDSNRYGGCNYLMTAFYEKYGLYIGSTAAVLVGAELVVAVSGILLIYFFAQKSRERSESGFPNLMSR